MARRKSGGQLSPRRVRVRAEFPSPAPWENLRTFRHLAELGADHRRALDRIRPLTNDPDEF